MSDFLQHVRKLLKKLNEEEKDLVAAAAVLVLKMKVIKVKMAEKKKREKNIERRLWLN